MHLTSSSMLGVSDMFTLHTTGVIRTLVYIKKLTKNKQLLACQWFIYIQHGLTLLVAASISSSTNDTHCDAALPSATHLRIQLEVNQLSAPQTQPRSNELKLEKCRSKTCYGFLATVIDLAAKSSSMCFILSCLFYCYCLDKRRRLSLCDTISIVYD